MVEKTRSVAYVMKEGWYGLIESINVLLYRKRN